MAARSGGTPRLHRLSPGMEALRRSLRMATDTIRELDAQGALTEIARRDPGPLG